jgi:hypothetical protein
MNAAARILPIVIVPILGLMVLVWFWQINKFFVYLRQKHPAEYEAMGSPSLIMNNTPKNNIACLRFITGNRPAELADPHLEVWCRFLARFFYTYMALFLIAVISIVGTGA